MGRPQSGILPDANASALFLTLAVDVGSTAAKALRDATTALPDMTEELAAAGSDAGLVSVVGFGAAVWDRLFPEARPVQLRPFRAIEGEGGKAPATPGDVFLHLRSDRPDLNFELGRRVMGRIGGAATVVEEIHGFRYLDKRDLTGFVDGTENPTGDDRAEVALVGAADPGFAGGSYINLQRYVHDLAAWENLPVTEQEEIIGRTKADNVEFDAEVKAPIAHIKRVSIKEDGRSLEMLRHSLPYGTTSEHGLYFVAYAATPDIFDKMLARMLIADDDGAYDHLMKYSRAVTGAAFFAPPRDWLESPER